MSYGHPRWAAVRTAKKRNLLWTVPATLFFLLGLGFLAVFVINYIGGLQRGDHYLVLIISGSASPFLTLSIFSMLLGALLKACGYLASLSYVKLNEQLIRPVADEHRPAAPAVETPASFDVDEEADADDEEAAPPAL
jgi:hypothetical protein